ncbi:MAG: DUF4832 domain-containing protein [Chitinophagaceae bacterium]
MLLKRMLLRNRSLVVLAISATLIASCRKMQDIPAAEQSKAGIKPDSTATTPDTSATNPAIPTTATTPATTALKPFTFTEIPYSSADLVNPGRGAEQWHGGNEVNLPSAATSTQRLDVYYRFVWTRLEGASQGSYNWSYFDGLVNNAIQKRQKLSFGIMTSYPEGTTNEGLQTYDGGYAAYPQYLHDQMQSESIKDWRTGSTWTPNYNSPSYLNRLLALHQALNSHIETASYNGVKYKDVIQFIDIRGYGSWGEWNSSNLVSHTNEYPAGTFPTIASFKKIVDAHTKGFPNFPLVAMIAAFDANWLGIVNNPPEIAHYILTTRNNWGPIGWRRDQWGATDQYLKDYLENNNRSFNGVVLKNLIMERWKTSPITGEPAPFGGDMSDLERQIRLYHATSFGNGNYGNVSINAIGDQVRAASKASGYRLKILSGEAPQAIAKNAAFNIKTVWQNVGLAPTYENWNVVFELQNAGNTAVWSGISSKKLKLFLPATSGTPTTDNFTLPATVPAGTYKLVVRIKDPSGYRQNISLAVNGRNADGSYTIFSNVTVK